MTAPHVDDARCETQRPLRCVSFRPRVKIPLRPEGRTMQNADGVGHGHIQKTNKLGRPAEEQAFQRFMAQNLRHDPWRSIALPQEN
ncbi:hypothetical protein CLCR_02136 [Cladophialophora carrionii]|uniref:Uncharacterized protein n=1 Tax=Cladophialophora carrionii TaxID=86049 RepID=A0A1C1CD61_9EURO|nr:hypothetical protein CLCR_02136 [Cladophialophora carrionii]